MNVQKVDTASANQESKFSDRFLDTFLNKEVILPTIGVVVILTAVWAFMTKCGRRRCCKDKKLPSKLLNRKSVKTERDEITTNNDLESNLEKHYNTNTISDNLSS